MPDILEGILITLSEKFANRFCQNYRKILKKVLKLDLEGMFGEKSENMNSNEFKNIIAKGIFQREFAKSSGINRSVLNDIINGKINPRRI